VRHLQVANVDVVSHFDAAERATTLEGGLAFRVTEVVSNVGRPVRSANMVGITTVTE
jgi:hypothetical protein